MLNNIVKKSVVMGPFKQEQFYQILITNRMLIGNTWRPKGA